MRPFGIGLRAPHNPAARGELLGAAAPWRNRSRPKKNKPTLNAIHKTALVRSWLAQAAPLPPALHPTHSWWINQVERWFAQLSQKQIKRDNHHSVKQLQEAIETSVKDHSASPKPFRWVKSAAQILASVTRFARSNVL
jgi:hypothetical protein